MPKKTIQALAGRTVRCILFDLGNTLWTPSDQTRWRILEHEGNQRAVACLREYIGPEALAGTDTVVLGNQIRDAVNTQIRDKYRQDSEYEPDFAPTAAQGLHQLGFEKVDRVAGAAIFEALRVRIPGSRLLFDDTFSTLALLRQRSFLLGIVTNRHWGGVPFMEDLGTIGLLNYFEPRHIAISADLGIRKPNPAIFLHALNALDVAPEESVMVGDSLSADIAGAKSLDIFAVWKPSPYLRAEAKAAAASSTLDVRSTENEKYQLLSYGRERYKEWGEQFDDAIEPDLIIEHVSDLLDVFLEVGVQ